MSLKIRCGGRAHAALSKLSKKSLLAPLYILVYTVVSRGCTRSIGYEHITQGYAVRVP